jgi:hypothetical protein
MFALLTGGLLENRGDLLVAFLPRPLGRIRVSVPRLRFTRESGQQIPFGLCPS